MKRGLLSLSAIVLLSLAWAVPHGTGQPSAAEETAARKALGLPETNEDLIRFFRQRTLSADEVPAVEVAIAQLGSPRLEARTLALAQLIGRGPAVAGLLAPARDGNDPLQAAAAKSVQALLNRKMDKGSGVEALALVAHTLAARQVPETAALLLDAIPGIEDTWLEEELLATLGRLTLHGDRVAPLLLEALKDRRAAPRQAAAYLLGRRGPIALRDKLRPLLTDPDAGVRRAVVEGFVGKRSSLAWNDSAAADAALLRTAGVEATPTALLAFFRRRTAEEADQARARALVAELGNVSYVVRARAADRLVKEGTRAVPFLQPATQAADTETARRARQCLRAIRRASSPALPIAAAHLLARGEAAPAEALRVLLAYLPFADDANVEDETTQALTLLAARCPQIEPSVLAALADPLAARRGAAAYALGHIGTESELARVRKLLDDTDATVRERAALGLAAARDPMAVPRLIALLDERSSQETWRIEELLYRLAGDGAPSAADTAAGRPQAWTKWWRDKGKTVDLARLNEGEGYRGLFTVCEYSAAGGPAGGQVWEARRDGVPRAKLVGLFGAMDAHALPNGRFLVAENNSNRVVEYDQNKTVLWECRVPGNPIACQRLPNGNTFVAMYNQIVEVTPDKREVYRFNPGPQHFLFGAFKTRDGRVVAVTAQGVVLELAVPSGKQLRTVNLGTGGNWSGVEMLANGHYLVATLGNSQIREIDPTNGKTVWSANYPGAFRATRLPNGHTLVASMTARKVAELDRSGAIRWEHQCAGQPWNVHFR